MAAYNTSSAYKLDEVYEQAAQKKKATLKLIRGRKNRVLSTVLTLRSVSTFLLVITVMCLIVYNQTCLNEVTGEINSYQKLIHELESENVRLTSSLETTISPHALAERAQQELGLQKLDKYQIEYVNLYKDNRIELTEEAPQEGFSAKLSIAINGALQQIKEYIGIS